MRNDGDEVDLCYALPVTTYRDSGVDIKKGDRASCMAYKRAASTFASRKGVIGEPLLEKDGYAGLLDMAPKGGPFGGDYYLVQTDDGTGSKIDLACALAVFDSLGFDLLAMVTDDAVCTGAEVISVSNTLDVPHVDPQMVDRLLFGLATACKKQHIVIPAGEIAEVPSCVKTAVWSATAVGIVEKNKILRPEEIKPGDVIIALRERGIRCNGFSLIRKILSDHKGERWYEKPWKGKLSWGQALLTRSTIYHDAILTLIGRFHKPRKVNIRGIAHITGGGIPSKLGRVLKKSGYGACLTNIWPPPPILQDIMELGSVSPEEAYRTWNMGNGMLIVVPPKESDKACALLEKAGIEAKIAGEIVKEKIIVIQTAKEPISFPLKNH